MEQVYHRGRSPQAVGDDRGRRRTTRRCWRSGRFSTDQAGYAAMRKLREDLARSGVGGRGQRTAPAGRWPNGCSRTANTWWTCRPSSPPGFGCSTPATTARPTPMTRTRSRWSRSAPRACGCCLSTASSRRCGCSTDRREALTRRRVQTVDRLQALLAELLPGRPNATSPPGRPRRCSPGVRPRDLAGKTRRRIAAEELAELVAVEAEDQEAAPRELKAHGPGPRLDG